VWQVEALFFKNFNFNLRMVQLLAVGYIVMNILEEHHVKMPPVFRYLPQKYIDEFFNSGKLRLSAFSEFAKHTDEQRLDTEEGWLIVDIKIPSIHKRLRSKSGIGFDSYILSTSLRGDSELMREGWGFGTDGYFKINDVESFGKAIGLRIATCTRLITGNCKYVDEKEISREMGVEAEKAIAQDTQGRMNLQRVMGLIVQVMYPHACFWKLKRYAHQQEFRFVWNVGHEVHEPLLIECPEAVQFCERIT